MKESTFQALVINTLLFLVKAQVYHPIHSNFQEQELTIAIQDLEFELRHLKKEA